MAPKQRRAVGPETNTAVLTAAVTVRRKRGISLEQIAEETKIGVRTLRAIEDGNFDKLPGGIYNTSYIRQYARAIDFDEQELLTWYYQATGEAPPGSAEPDKGAGRSAALNRLGHPSTVAGS